MSDYDLYVQDEGWTDFVEWMYERDKEIGFD